jgi:hypothetical protein
MKKRIIIISVVIIALIISTTIYVFKSHNLHFNSNISLTPERNPLVPKDALWYGGQEGGSWIVVNPGSKPNVFSMKAYDRSGGLSVAGDFKVDENCANTILSVEEVRKLLNAYNGRKFFLITIGSDNKNCKLIPVE